MKAVALSCPQCGGSQDVTDDQRLVECRYCRTLLRVERTATGEIQQLSVENERLELENALLRLDKEWEAAKGGIREASSRWGSVLAYGGACCIGVTLITLLTVPIPANVQIILFLIGSVFVAVGLRERAAGIRFENAVDLYEKRRASLVKALELLEKSNAPHPSYEDTKSRRQRLDRISYPAADA